MLISKNNPRVHIPDGEYEVICTGHKFGIICHKAPRQFLYFKITSEQYNGEQLFMSFNVPYNKKIPQGSRYYKTWVFVNNWQLPSRNASMSARLFVNKMFLVKTRTVKPKYNDKEMPSSQWYSIIDSILEVITG